MIETVAETRGEVALCAAVLRQAFVELPDQPDSILGWVRDRSKAVGSFEWYAEALGFEPSILRAHFFRKAYRPRRCHVE